MCVVVLLFSRPLPTVAHTYGDDADSFGHRDTCASGGADVSEGKQECKKEKAERVNIGDSHMQARCRAASGAVDRAREAGTVVESEQTLDSTADECEEDPLLLCQTVRTRDEKQHM